MHVSVGKQILFVSGFILLAVVGIFFFANQKQLSLPNLFKKVTIVPLASPTVTSKSATKLAIQQIEGNRDGGTYFINGILLDEPKKDQHGALVGSFRISGDVSNTALQYILVRGDGTIIYAKLGSPKELWQPTALDEVQSRLHTGVKIQFRISPQGDTVAKKGLVQLFETEKPDPLAFSFIPTMVGVYE